MKTILYTVAISALLCASAANAEHDAACKKPHGKVTAVTQDMIAVDDKPYKVGKSTRVMRDGHQVRLTDLKTGDTVCVDTRGKDDIVDGEIAGLAILTASRAPAIAVKEKEIVREKVSFHDKDCPHTHARVSQVDGTTLVVNGKPLAVGENVIVRKGDQFVTVETLKAGDIVCLHDEPGTATKEKITTVLVLDPSQAYLVPDSKVIERERIEIR